jgi:NADH-quinone oxidoreductase subunit J
MTELAFLLLAAALLASALAVVLHPNPVKCAMALVVTLFLQAVVFVLLDAHMIAALQVIVYAGAIMVLFLFVIMLLNLQSDDPEGLRRPHHVVLRVGAWLGGGVLGAELVMLFLGQAFAPRAPAVDGYGTALPVARALFTDYLLPFELTGLLLLVAVIGPVILARRTEKP